jgi:hypothetical protein
MPIYRSTGTLTGYIERESVSLAQAYLTDDDMTQFLDDSIKESIERVQWYLDSNGHDYYVEAIAKRELTDDELRVLAEWVSGQNSDGLGESFEQQSWAEQEGEDEDDWSMISFDWKTNDSKFTRI